MVGGRYRGDEGASLEDENVSVGDSIRGAVSTHALSAGRVGVPDTLDKFTDADGTVVTFVASVAPAVQLLASPVEGTGPYKLS